MSCPVSVSDGVPGDKVAGPSGSAAAGQGTSTDTEQWHQTVERVVNGTFSMQRTWVVGQGLPWDQGRAQAQAQVSWGVRVRMHALRMRTCCLCPFVQCRLCDNVCACACVSDAGRVPCVCVSMLDRLWARAACSAGCACCVCAAVHWLPPPPPSTPCPAPCPPHHHDTPTRICTAACST